MNQISRPMQIALLATALVAAVWFLALKPKDSAEPVAATPATPTAAATPRPVDAGGATAQTGLGKAVESANNAAATSNAQTHAEEAQTGEQTPAATPTTAAGTTPASPAATTPAGTTPAPAAPAAAAAKAKAAKAKAAKDKRSHAQRHADHVTKLVGKDLQARRAVVVLVSSPSHSEDKILRRRVRKEIDRRHGRVQVYLVPVSQVGLYDGLLGTLNLAQTPSTIVIAPNNEAKVLGGLTSTARIDRLTSAALLLKPAATK